MRRPRRPNLNSGPVAAISLEHAAGAVRSCRRHFVCIGQPKSARSSSHSAASRSSMDWVGLPTRHGVGVQCSLTTPSWQSFLLGDASGEIGDAELTWVRYLSDVRNVTLRSTTVTNAGLVHLQPLRRLESLSLGDMARTQITACSGYEIHRAPSAHRARLARFDLAGLRHPRGRRALRAVAMDWAMPSL